jgi:hypothetical protein
MTNNNWKEVAKNITDESLAPLGADQQFVMHPKLEHASLRHLALQPVGEWLSNAKDRPVMPGCHLPVGVPWQATL